MSMEDRTMDDQGGTAWKSLEKNASAETASVVISTLESLAAVLALESFYGKHQRFSPQQTHEYEVSSECSPQQTLRFHEENEMKAVVDG